MIAFRELMSHITAEPFAPFQVHVAGGRVFAVSHPECLQVGRNTFSVYAPPEHDPDGPQRWERLSLTLVESVAPLNTPVRSRGT